MRNEEVARVFAAMADILALQEENFHRINAYRRAAENIRTLGRDLEEIWQAGELQSIPGIGETLAEKIDELMRTGHLQAYEKLRAAIPEGLPEMLNVPDVGPKRAALFWKQAGITTLEELEQAAREGRLRSLPGMGEKSEVKVLVGLEALKRQHSGRTRLDRAWVLAKRILDALQAVPGVTRAVYAGSLRRMRETVGDLDLLVAADDPALVMDAFRSLPEVAEVLLSGPTKTSVRTGDGLQIDLRVLEAERWGTALQYFTGSQAHNVHLREIALQQGLSLSEYSFKRADGSEFLCAEEREVYATLGLPLIPPELREDRGEIDAALAGRLPELVAREDLRGDFQFHTTYSDGSTSLLEMAQAARAAGLQYAVVTDHTHGLGVVRGMTVDDVRRQRAEIEAVNARLGGDFRVLAGAEVEVRADGSLDLPDEVLAELDVVVASVHSGLRQGREVFTARSLAAVRHPHVDVLGHPTGRLINERPGADLDFEAVFQAAAESGTALEINAHPSRLDLPAAEVRRALELGARVVISSDAHDPQGFDVLPFGVATARRGWATPADVLNTRPVEEILAWGRR